MASDITTLSAFFTEVTRLLDGEEVSNTDLSVGTLARIAKNAQRRIYRDVRSRYNEVAFSALTVTSNLATIPADFEAPSEIHFGKKPLEPVSPEFLRDYLDSNPTGDCRYFARTGSSFKFGPAVANGTAVQGSYFARLPDLSDATIAGNALFQAADDLFVYGALVEAADFFDKVAKFQIWATKYASIKDAINRNDAMAAYGAGRAVRRPSAKFNR